MIRQALPLRMWATWYRQRLLEWSLFTEYVGWTYTTAIQFLYQAGAARLPGVVTLTSPCFPKAQKFSESHNTTLKEHRLSVKL